MEAIGLACVHDAALGSLAFSRGLILGEVVYRLTRNAQRLTCWVQDHYYFTQEKRELWAEEGSNSDSFPMIPERGPPPQKKEV